METEKTTIRLSKEKRKKIVQIAEVLDCTYGDKGSIGKLLEAIADNRIILSKNFSQKT